jgi:hypothetical protein
LKVAILCDVKVLRLIQGKSKKVKPTEKLSSPQGAGKYSISGEGVLK